MGEDNERPGVIIVVNVAEESPSYHMDIRPGDRLLGIEGNYFKNEINIGMVSNALGNTKFSSWNTCFLLVFFFFFSYCSSFCGR